MNPDKPLNLCIFLFNVVSPTESRDPVSEQGLSETAPAHLVVVIYSKCCENKHILYEPWQKAGWWETTEAKEGTVCQNSNCFSVCRRDDN